MSTIRNIVVAGLGGQGVLKVTDILAEAVFRSGFDVKKSEVHGMSQRGGSVSSEVRYGESVASPMVPAGEADVLAVLDSTQVDVAKAVLKADGVLITPEDLPLDKLQNPKALNTMMLGAVSNYVDIPVETLLEALKANLPEKLHEMNVEMFNLGRNSR
ncbi:MAG: pyruvate ferredoxin oxidoreductase [Lentisphaerae bacterium]|jgi:indolepyruvate ferredoxin oxidoreductase beta subunit|nr:pyruvate ferredoxin oxidoreductase [Lentisphaerota bacterium]MBR2873862.1 2-oxoacid:acceptor oxidoreductase family protein [Lentisphaeria bacterium]